MKIVHAADLHIDSPFRGLPVEGSRLPAEFHIATRRAFRNLIDLCLQEAAGVLLLAGDIFDSDCVDMATGEFFLMELDRLREVDTQVVLVYGNHDAECSVMRRLRLPAHVHRLATDYPETRVFEKLGLAVHGQSFAETAVWDNLARSYPPPIPDLLNIGLLHTNAIGYVDDPLYAPCTVAELADKRYDYWALGHLHWHEILHEEPWVAYPGNLQARYMEEAGPKGCILVESQGQEILGVRQVLLDVVRWVNLNVRVHAKEVWNEDLAKVNQALQVARDEASVRPLIARIVIEGDGPHYDSWFSKFTTGTDYATRVRELASRMDHLWLEDVVVKGSASSSFYTERFVCQAWRDTGVGVWSK